LIVGIIVVLSLSLTGAFDKSPSPATSASQPESGSHSSSNNSTTNLNSSSGSNNASNVVVVDDSNETFPNTTSSAPISNTNSTQPDGEDSEPSNGNTTSDNATNNGAPGEGDGSTTEKEPLTAPGGARYPTDPNEYWDVVWIEDFEFITALTFDNGETVFIRWPECVGMEGPECETLIRSTNPYVTEVFLVGPDDFTDASFQNDRVNVWLDAAGVLVRDVPYIG
jgi:Potato inhibitor I family